MDLDQLRAMLSKGASPERDAVAEDSLKKASEAAEAATRAAAAREVERRASEVLGVSESSKKAKEPERAKEPLSEPAPASRDGSVISSVKMGYSHGTSDKVYVVEVHERTHTTAKRYSVVAHWGRRGARLQRADKSGWTDIHTASSIAEQLANSKLKKGYELLDRGGRRMII